MGSEAFYNDNDRKVCTWLRKLVARGHVTQGSVDERSITELGGSDLAKYRRVHLFAGIGGWDYALQLAGWPDDWPVWTGSCPCQPFSNAGKRKGINDERHLWPEMRRLIAECRPPVVFGEQVASRAGREWLAGVRTDLEALGYAVGAADLCAASVGAPHIRQRLWWVGHSERGRWQGGGVNRQTAEKSGTRCKLGNTWDWCRTDIGICGRTRGLLNTNGSRRGELCGSIAVETKQSSVERAGAWDRFVFVPCGDGKTRRIEPGLAPLVDGVPARVVRVRGYGNAIVPQVAATFVRAYMEATGRTDDAN